jgi:hypothetical protein
MVKSEIESRIVGDLTRQRVSQVAELTHGLTYRPFVINKHTCSFHDWVGSGGSQEHYNRNHRSKLVKQF